MRALLVAALLAGCGMNDEQLRAHCYLLSVHYLPWKPWEAAPAHLVESRKVVEAACIVRGGK